MLDSLLVIGAVLGGPVPPPASVGQPDPRLVLRAVRSYVPEQRRTEVNAIVEVPYILMEPTGEGDRGSLSYRVAVKVRDTTGLTLLQNSWQNHATAAARRPDASAVDMVHFSLAPGRYSLEVTVEDSVSGRQASSTVDLEGFATEPAASDLLLSPKIRPATPEDSVPQPAELRWGKMLVTAAARLQLTPLRSTAFYLLEAYSPTEAQGTLDLRVVDSAGKAILKTTPTKVYVPAGGGVLKGQLDLTGLPAGAFVMVAALTLGSNTVERTAAFTMAGLQETLSKDVGRRDSARTTDEGYFDAMNSAELDSAQAPLAVIATGRELSAYKGLTVSAKRRFMTQFWAERDPTPSTPVNEARQQFYQYIAFANEHYREGGGRSRPGWMSDRGRVYLRNGAPDEVLQREQQAQAPPYEVWRYRTGKDRWYIFADRSRGVGLFTLIHSNDLKETGLPNWREILTPEAVQDIGRFLAIDFFDRRREE
jgi:GWxTD domain-containing protein